MSQPNEPSKVIVVDLQMPFFSIVVLMVKWALASIPAIIILGVAFSLLPGLMGGLILPTLVQAEIAGCPADHLVDDARLFTTLRSRENKQPQPNSVNGT